MDIMIVEIGQNKETLRCLENKLGFLGDNFDLVIHIKDNFTTLHVIEKESITGEWLAKGEGETLEESVNDAIRNLYYDANVITQLTII